MRTHQEIDARSLALHRYVASCIRREPARFAKVQQTLTHWRQVVCSASQPYLVQWEQLVQQGMEACLRAAEEDSERAAALRQSSPFAGILCNAERFAFLKEWRQHHETQRS
jgi:hypothetical protein